VSTDDKDQDVRVKQLLEGKASLDDVVDAATQAELMRWFERPSFQQVEEEARPADPELEEARERRAKAIAAVDPALLAWIHQRVETKTEALLPNRWDVELHADATIAKLDETMVDRGHQIAEPREVEISDELKDDLKECAPQALLRDLHRPEMFFEKTFEWVDMAEDQKLDIVAEVAQAMRMNLSLPPLGLSPFEEERRLLVEDRATRRKPWTALVRKGGAEPGVERTRES